MKIRTLLLILFIFFSTLTFAETDDFDHFDEFDSSSELAVGFNDPWIGYNKFMTNFNNWAYDIAIRPLAKTYQKHVPNPVRVGIFQMFDNISFPIRFVNNIFQLKFDGAAIESFRFVINSTWGVAGFGDPARDQFKLIQRHEEFADTFAVWGMGHGPYFVLPILGPSSVRDTFGIIGDTLLRPTSYIEPIEMKYLTDGSRRFVKISKYTDEIDQVREEALDFYVFVRDYYYQTRLKEVAE